MSKEIGKKRNIEMILAIVAMVLLSVSVIVFGVLIVLEKTGVLYPSDEGDSEIKAPKIIDATPRTEGDFEYMILEGNTAIIVGWVAGESGATEAVTPTTIGGYPVTAVSDYVFAAYSKLDKITFSEGITYIGKGALYGAMAEVYLPSTLEQIGDSAFAGFSSEGVYYNGSEQDWKNVRIGGNNLAVKKVVFLSE